MSKENQRCGKIFMSRMARLGSLIKGKKDGGVCDGSLKNPVSVHTKGYLPIQCVK